MLGRKEERSKFSRNEDVEMGKTDHIYSRKQAHAHVSPVLKFSCKNKRLKWFGHCLRREHNYIIYYVPLCELSGRRSRDRPEKRWRDNMKEDMKKYQLTEDMAQDQKYWMTQIMARRWSGKVRNDVKEKIKIRQERINFCFQFRG